MKSMIQCILFHQQNNYKKMQTEKKKKKLLINTIHIHSVHRQGIDEVFILVQRHLSNRFYDSSIQTINYTFEMK